MLTNSLIFFIHVCQVVELPLSHNRVWTDSTIVLQWLRKCGQAILLSTTKQRESRVLTGGQSLQHLSSTCHFSKQHARIIYCARCFTTQKVAGRTKSQMPFLSRQHKLSVKDECLLWGMHVAIPKVLGIASTGIEGVSPGSTQAQQE